MQDEDTAIAGRQLADRVLQDDPVYHRHLVLILRAPHDLHGSLALLGGELRTTLAPTEMHQDLVDRHAVQPGRKGGIAAKAADLLVQLKKNLLAEVFRLFRIAGHTQGEGVNAAEVATIQLLE